MPPGTPQAAGDAPRLLAVYPAAWTLWEWIRGWAFTGFPWLQVGYAQIDGPASGWLPVLGVHGAGALTAFVAGGLALVLLCLPHSGRWFAAVREADAARA